MADTHIEVVTPGRTLYSGDAEMLVCRSTDGEIAFLADHMPYIGALDPGVVRVVGAQGATNGELVIAVHGGFVEVKENQVIMLAEVAELADEIDVARAQRAESEASSRAGEPEADAALRRAQVRLEVAATR
ncbi:MAG: ATP synthase F1 subunit epsilon [Acidimicrobiaceae bacterium]|nr:ATP synthase F1 subunit epsilon [Acidimicrobiaceae bacterium]